MSNYLFEYLFWRSYMRKNIKKFSLFCLIFASLFSINVYAKTSKEQISDAKKAAEEKKQQLEDVQNQMEELESSKAQLEGSLAALNNKLETLSNEMTELEGQAAEKQQEIDDTQIKLDEAMAVEQQQYESMKIRIKYLYELGGDGSMLQMIIEEKDFADILNKADYYSQITQYDRRMLVEYQETKNQIAQAKQKLEQDKADIDTIMAQKEAKQQEIQILVNETSNEIANQTQDIEAAQAKALEYEKELDKQNETIENLQAQIAYEESLKNKTSSSSTQNRTPSGGSNYNILTSKSGYEAASSSSNLDIMAAIIYCEAGAEPYQGQLAVGSVIMNRIHSSGFPDTLLGVLYQKSQFTPVMSGRFAVVLANRLATDSCYQAASEVLNGTNVVPDCLFFRTVIDGIDGQIIGTQIFY